MTSKMFLELALMFFSLNGANGQLSITPSGIVNVTENSELTIACSYTGSITYNLVKWSNRDNVYARIASNCNQFGGQPIDSNFAEFTCTNNGKDFTLTLKTVKKEQDGERWSCNVDTLPETTVSEEVIIKIKVKVTSVELQKNGVPINTDKVEVNIDVPTIPPFVCNIIPSISWPPPTVIWYIGTTIKQQSTSTSYTVTSSEADHNKIIYCKAYNLQPEGQAVESSKPKLYVRVQVTSVELQMNGNTINTDTVEVDISVPTNPPFECIITPNNSRPPPTVIWYIGSTVKQNSTSTSYTVTATEDDNDQRIYCKAYNRPWNQPKESAKAKLLVRVQVTSVQLQTNGETINTDTVPVEVDKDVPSTFRCNIIPSTSRPPPTVIWYIGSTSKQQSTNTSYTVTATETDHDQRIYCKAYNRPWNQAVVSAKPKLYVRVHVPNVQLDTGNLPVNGQTFQVTAGSPVPLNCKPGFSRPSATIDWYIQSSQTLTREHTQTYPNTEYILTAEIDNHLDQIFCQAYIPRQVPKAESPKFNLYVNVNVTAVTLKYGENIPSTGETLYFTAGTPKPLTCTPSFCRPEATIDWYIDNNFKHSSTSQTYSLNAVNADHNKPIYCKGYNNVTSDTERPVSNKPVLYVRVPAEVPLILNESTDGLTLLDGDSSTVQCQSTPTRPASTISWKNGNSVLSDTNTREEPEAGGLVSVISTVSLVAQREFHNTVIICQSKIDGQNGTPETRKLLKVWWRPSKPSVQTINGGFPWVEGGRGQLTCASDNDGNPNATIKWTTEVGTMNAQNQLELDRLSYLDHKRAIKCGMENSFTKIKDEIVESEEISLKVHFSPKFLTTDVVFVGKIEENVNITFRIYCNPKVDTAKLYVNGSVTNDNGKYVLMITEGVSEELNVTVTIIDLEEGDFANYLLKVTNSINTTEVNFTVTAESIPSQPTAFGLKELRGSIAIFYWERGFNGGHKQRFLLQLMSETEDSWSNKTIVEEHDMNSNLGNSSYVASISNLNPGTYEVRLIAVNSIGAAEPVLLETTFTIRTEDEPEAFPVAAAAGGGVGAAVLIIAIVAVILVVWKRRSPKDDDFNRNIIKPPRGQDSSDNCGQEITMNVMYESADNVQRQPNGNDASAKDDKPLNIYEKVNKVFKKKSPEPTNDVYSQVQKPKKKDKQTKETDKKKMKKQKKGKNNTPKEDVYENVDSHTDTTQDDKIYENHQCSIEDEKPKRTVNQDGLIYVKVDLPNKTDAKNMRPIIHGEDDRTIYAEVAFGEVGEPLPESDEEDTTEKQ